MAGDAKHYKNCGIVGSWVPASWSLKIGGIVGKWVAPKFSQKAQLLSAVKMLLPVCPRFAHMEH